MTILAQLSQAFAGRDPYRLPRAAFYVRVLPSCSSLSAWATRWLRVSTRLASSIQPAYSLRWVYASPSKAARASAS
jgi:hypothetical protein